MLSTKNNTRGVITLIMLLVSGPSRSATYHVATTGSNADPGTAAQPWLTIQYAADQTVAADTVVVSSGTYAERVILSNAGTAGQAIVFLAQPALNVTVQGFSMYGDYNHVEGFNITTQAVGWQGGGFWVAADHLEIIHNYLYEIPGAAIQGIWGTPAGWSRYVHIARNRIFHCDDGISAEGFNWTIEDNEIERPLFAGGAGDYTRFFGDSIVFRHNWLHGAQLAEIGTAHVDGFQTFDNNGEFATNITIEGNFVESFHQGVILESTDTAGSTANIVIRNNVFIGGEVGGSWGVLLKDNIRHGLVVANNLFANLQYHGVGVREHSEAIVRNNIFFHAGSNYWADTTSTVSGGHNLIDPVSYPYYAEPSDMLDTDPLFTDASNFIGMDGLPFTADDGFHLQPASPAIDAGMAADVYGAIDDIFGTMRPIGSAYDIGPVESDPTTGWEAPEARTMFSIVPNPAGDRVRIEFNAPTGSAMLLVTDLMGNVVRRQRMDAAQQGEFHLDTGALASGAYIIQVAVDGARYQQRLIVAH